MNSEGPVSFFTSEERIIVLICNFNFPHAGEQIHNCKNLEPASLPPRFLFFLFFAYVNLCFEESGSQQPTANPISLRNPYMTSELPGECVFQYSIGVDVTVCFAVCSVRARACDFRVHGTSYDLPPHCAAVIGCDTILSALSGGYNRNLTIMAPVMNMSGQLQTKACDLDKAPLYVVRADV